MKPCEFFDLILNRLETIYEKTFKVWMIRVAPPKKAPKYNLVRLGAPLTYVVNDYNLISKIETNLK